MAQMWPGHIRGRRRSWRGAGHQAAGGARSRDVDARRGRRTRGGPVGDACSSTHTGLVELPSDRALHDRTVRETGLTGSSCRGSRAQSLTTVRSCGRARGAWPSTTFAPWSTLLKALPTDAKSSSGPVSSVGRERSPDTVSRSSLATAGGGTFMLREGPGSACSGSVPLRERTALVVSPVPCSRPRVDVCRPGHSSGSRPLGDMA